MRSSASCTPRSAGTLPFLAGEDLAAARTDIGVGAIPNWAACYRAAVRSFTTLELSPDEVFAAGQRELAAIRKEMRARAERSSGTSDVPSLLRTLREDTAFTYRSRDETVETSARAIERAPEVLADEMGLYSSEIARMGLLASQAWRAARLVIDAGVHTRGWSREQAVEHLGRNTTMSPVQSEFHDRVLENGAVTLPMLRQQVERWTVRG